MTGETIDDAADAGSDPRADPVASRRPDTKGQPDSESTMNRTRPLDERGTVTTDRRRDGATDR